MSKKRKVIITLFVIVAAFNAWIITHHNIFADPEQEVLKKIISCCIIDAAYIGFVLGYERVVALPVELWQNRELIWKLALNDFKSRYAGSYLGIFWAFVPQIVTVAVYCFIFSVGVRQDATGHTTYPFVLWLVAGITPWFFFSEAWGSGTSAFLSYTYLVKKVVFKISILPIIKVVSALFIHFFFIAIVAVLMIALGYPPTVYWLQIPYFTCCTFLLVLGMSYVTASLTVFFRDIGQFIGILMQIGIWLTPIMWHLDSLSRPLQILFKLNPIYYCVDGFRMAFLDNMWFFEHFYSTAYFWIFTVVMFIFGAVVFKKLKGHFADVL
ncbi:teichoic acid transport system permease protein [Lachnospiraceae bacterium KH1T2]|jgi:teichoic acid transport system permease protein|nr:teichoic acid transport system permease protein [Lachnospiraceae bacterium KH1T2]